MVAAAADGGGGDGFPHVNGRYNGGEIVSGTGHTSGGPHAQSGLEQGVRVASNLSPVGLGVNLVNSLTGGARKDVANALKPTDPDTLQDHAHKWNTISTKTSNYAQQVYGAMSALSTWSGDDADKAREALRGLSATFSTASGASYTMSSQLGQMASTLKWAKDNYGDDGGAGGTAKNVLTGGGEDDEAANAFQKMLTNFETSMGYMPDAVPYEVKDDGGAAPLAPPTTPIPGGPVGPAPTAGGAASAPHVGNPAGPHIEPPKLPVEPPVYPPPPPPPPPVVQPPVVEPPSNNGTDYPGTGTVPYTGGGAGISPGLDTSGSLAGYDGSGGGGGGASGSLAGGAGDLPGGAGGAPGGGSGLGTGPGSGLGAGAGAGGGANGGLGAGAGGGGAAGGVAGGRGMMPMHGGGGNDDDERERTTWLNEDDDVWGAEENLPGVIH